MTAPIAGTDVWQAVMGRAGHHCQCPHAGHPGHRIAGRCMAGADAHLIAGPREPGPHPERMLSAPPVEELTAWCPPCWDHAVKAARRHARTEKLAVDAGALF